ncbi:hypothetical protein [Paucisalibacillus sp. EB02]|uniref:hypothetical protein n=1 Tax=Paucisalibacillus sp. EB02 TaxID=1347087 RepID=UPI0005AAB831|nr:hypothetical protein [Paucisalibacillus sp. EB02]
MTILIQNCFHWIGYHYVNFLLEKGIVVKGVDKIDTEKKENLYMFIGRNSSFELMDSPKNNKAKIAIVIGDCNSAAPCIDAERIFQLDVNGLKNKIDNATIIKAPLLFGEWMDMTEEGLVTGEKIIRFDSVKFQSESVYIGDFVKATYPVLKLPPNSSNITVFSKKIFLNESVKLENSIYIRDNVPIEDRMKKVLTHYRRYKKFY